MTISLNISQHQEDTLRHAWGADVGRAALEALAVEGYRSGRLSAAEVGVLVGIEDRWTLNQWLAERRVALNYTSEDLDADRRALDRLLGKSA